MLLLVLLVALRPAQYRVVELGRNAHRKRAVGADVRAPEPVLVVYRHRHKARAARHH